MGATTVLGVRLSDFQSWDSWVRLLHKPCDPSSLAVFRIAFGLLMVVDIPQERGLASLDARYPDPPPHFCRFPLLNFLRPLPLDLMYLLYLGLWMGAVGIMLGCLYRASCAVFVCFYWYLFLLDKTSWNNHSYLYGLIATQLALCDANRFWSIDGLLRNKIWNKHVPLWNYSVLRFQIFLVYFIAGLKKLDSDWLMGYSMGNLSRHWLFSPFKLVLSEEHTSVLIVHGCGFLLDISAGFLLLVDVTRPLAIVFVTYFHVMNSQLFSIGMFPYTMIATSALFCAYDWPRRLISTCVALPGPAPELSPSCLYPVQNSGSDAQHSGSPILSSPTILSSASPLPAAATIAKSSGRPSLATKDSGKARKDGGTFAASDCGKEKTTARDSGFGKEGARDSEKGTCRPGWRHKVAAGMFIVFVCEQLFLPYSHFLTKGYNNWTQGLYGYSWDMMVHSRSHQHVKVTYRDRTTGVTGFLNPGVWTQTRRWKDHADMLKQYSACMSERLREFNISDPEIYFDIWVSLNDRFQQRLFDPRVDIVRADWSPFRSTPWLLPLLVDLSPWRRRLAQIESELGNQTEVVFIADFPGLHLENFIGADLDAPRITVLSGSVIVEIVATGRNITLGEGESMEVPSGEFHRVHTISTTPSCYSYEYENRTETALAEQTRQLLSAWHSREADGPMDQSQASDWLAAEIATILNSSDPERGGVDSEGPEDPDWRAEALLRRFSAEESRSRRRKASFRQRAEHFFFKKFFIFRKSLLKTAFALRNIVTGYPSASQLQWEEDLVNMGRTHNTSSQPSHSEL